MSNTNKMKKTEKRLLIIVLTTFNIIKKSTASFLKFFLKAGNQRVTIMFIPHSEKKVFNFRVNTFLLFLSFSLFLSLLCFITILTITNNYKSKQIITASIKADENEKLSKEYQKMINKVLENHTIFKSKMNKLISQLDSDKIKVMKEENLFQNSGGPVNKIEVSQLKELGINKINSDKISEYYSEKLEVNNLLKDYNYSILAFAEFNNMAGNYNKLIKDLPFGSPVKSPSPITSSFGLRIHPIHKVLDMHQGIDLANMPGTPITATAPGIVEKVEWNPFGYGWYLKISHKLGFSTLYAHLRTQPVVSAGDKIKKGQLIGYMGNTGATTGTHLHYEIRLGDNLLDPWNFVATY